MIYTSATVRLVNNCFATRTSRIRTSRGLVYAPYVSIMIYTSLTVRLVNHCFTTRTSRTSRGPVCKPKVPLMICSSSRGLVSKPLVPLMIYTSPTVRLVNHCFTTRTSPGPVYIPEVPVMICSSQTVRLVDLYIHPKSL